MLLTRALGGQRPRVEVDVEVEQRQHAGQLGVCDGAHSPLPPPGRGGVEHRTAPDLAPRRAPAGPGGLVEGEQLRGGGGGEEEQQ